MDSNNSSILEKSRNESGRVPSPASISSVHSIRPLEWDSGADIGYEFKDQSGLSTVERIALQSGSANLFEKCVSVEPLNRLYQMKRFGDPLAQSSPFFISSDLVRNEMTPPNVDGNPYHPLVDYTISDYSFDGKTDTSVAQYDSKVVYKSDQLSQWKSDGSSRSLDDLRFLKYGQTPDLGANRSYSSQNMLISVHKSSSEKIHSSSSAATLVPQLIQRQSRQYSNKSVQVDEAQLNQENVSAESNLEFFRKICNDDQRKDSSTSRARSKNSISENDEESVDGGSFEYVPGSIYAGQTLDIKSSSTTPSQHSSSLNSMCSEVTDGVTLLTKYVNNLDVSNKRKVMEKVAKLIMNNLSELSQFKKSTNCSTTSNASHRLLDSGLELKPRTSSYSRLSNEDSSRNNQSSSNLDNQSKNASSSYVETKSSTNESPFPESVSEARDSSKDSSSLPTSLNSFRNGLDNSRSSSAIEASSSCKIDSNSDIISSSSSRRTYSADFYNLKVYLKKEREVQLKWIKSNFDHLNNLRKLCESQKLLKDELKELKKLYTSRSANDECPQSDVPQVYSSRKKPAKLISTNRTNRKLRDKNIPTTDMSDNTTCDSYASVSKSESVARDSGVGYRTETVLSGRCRSVAKRKEIETINDKSVCQCCRKSNEDKSENKENILSNANMNFGKGKSSKEHESTTIASKPPISYTVLFEEKPRKRSDGKTYKVQDHINRISVSRTTNRGKRIIKTKSISEIKSKSDENGLINQTITLQEYLIHNKPDYINRAEYRRKCLAEIAKLRELRDKSREELLAAVRNIDEMNEDIAKIVTIPPPLSVVRIFDDKTMKKETERKYQQLPEVQNKKIELKRRDFYRRNHIMAKVFTKKLQKKVLTGQLNLANDVNVISM